RDYEGVIPEGQYGGGPVIVWDRGSWNPIGEPHEALEKVHLDFELSGAKLHGRFVLVRTGGRDAKKPSWLLIKRNDEHAPKDGAPSVVDARPESVLSGRTIEDVAAGVPDKAQASAQLPKFGSIAPQLATAVKDLPASTLPFIYEIKYDGYRTL